MDIQGYKYNPRVGNFCKKKAFGFVKPYEVLRLRDIPEGQMMEAVSAIHFHRNGSVDWRIESDKEYAKRIAQEIGVW